jgi:hypothetical protein
LEEPKLERTLNTSSSVGIETKMLLSSSKIIGGKSSASSSSKSGEEEVNKLAKLVIKELPIAALSESHPLLWFTKS